MPFGEPADAVELANSTEAGLAVYVYTRDVSRAHRMIDALDAGMTGINTGLHLQRRGTGGSSSPGPVARAARRG